ncbi:hypothetical protein [Paenibacillus campi]|uniref:hypothetical protein n=1 Tax=Paenibacillus campi TaxID=3106031 RepID=UPI002B0004DB|nr:hypothetical protein [Paenibacillus sp. SGZ-1014]
MTKNKSHSYRHYGWTILLITAIVSMSINITLPAYAAETISKLHSAAWSTPLFAASTYNPDSSVVYSVKVIPSKALVYVKSSHSTNYTSNKSTDTFQAYSANDGKLQWSYNDLGESGDLGDTLYTNDGTVYFCNLYADGHYWLTSLHSSGKPNWKIKLPKLANAFPYTANLMKDGSLLVAVTIPTDSAGNVKSMLKRYDRNGKLLQQQTIPAYVMSASGNRIIVDTSRYHNNQTSLQHAKFEAYGLDLKRLYSHSSLLQFDRYDDQIVTLDDGTVFIGTYNKVAAGNMLFKFDAKGKLIWKHKVADDYRIQSTGNGYILYENRTFKLYTATSTKPSAIVTLKGTPADYTWIVRTLDGNVMVNMLDRTYILNPATLSIVEAWYRTPADAMFDYANDAIYTDENKGILHKYVISK